MPEQPAQQETFDPVVVGGGPGRYRVARLGLRTALVEKERPGRVCPNPAVGERTMAAAKSAIGLPGPVPRPRR